MKLKKNMLWYYWIPLIGVIPFLFFTTADMDELWNTWYFDYQITFLILAACCDITLLTIIFIHP